MRASCKLAAQVLQHAGSLVRPGVTTDEIDAAVHAMVIAAGAYPSPLNYGKFPKSVCTSVNECLCHGIPDSRPLKDGDIINIDVTVYLNGYHGDTSAMFYICGPDVPVRKIGEAVQEVAKRHKFQVSKDFIGHGVGKVFHARPHVQHVRNLDMDKMQLNSTFTIEPILVEGSPKMVEWKDNWTVVTADGGLAAQMEHTLLITPNGAEVLTVT
ncbi:methionyl aminopeptidase [Monoraphidium neglectum]|uniref:Methionyl aminopeptidase n=1 Tax=Monoraphidium neglectum TaxID=145388 RepID=A0A0D2MUN5_9CHLO|nr:methionyl aminopeptidase [Monoraphidium neglectum]KIZ06250.1 methionyl aminopeptidase [Monoraphidium neglectum]|eukprot:XP_013905269.1 methionyl aminopeptidase [Monoraphidium neglectum]